VERAHDGPHEGGLAGAERSAEAHGVAGAQRMGERGGIGIESGRAVEDVIRCSQNVDWCFCA
jgi:hypothetical protein